MSLNAIINFLLKLVFYPLIAIGSFGFIIAIFISLVELLHSLIPI